MLFESLGVVQCVDAREYEVNIGAGRTLVCYMYIFSLIFSSANCSLKIAV